MTSSRLMTEGWFTDCRIRTWLRMEEAPVVPVVLLQMTLMATLCRSGTLNPSLTSPQAPLPSTLLTVYLHTNSGGKVSLSYSVDMNT